MAVGVADVGGEVFEELKEFGAGAGGEGAPALDRVQEAAEVIFGAGEGSHGVEEGVEAVGDLEVRGWGGGGTCRGEVFTRVEMRVRVHQIRCRAARVNFAGRRWVFLHPAACRGALRWV